MVIWHLRIHPINFVLIPGLAPTRFSTTLPFIGAVALRRHGADFRQETNISAPLRTS